MLKKELNTILEGMREEQKRQQSTLHDIQSDLMEYEKDHTLVIKLKSEVAGLRDDIGELIKVIYKNQGKMDMNIQKSVKKGLEPVGNLLENISDGIETNKMPMTQSAAKQIKRDNFLLKLVKNWNKTSIKDAILNK